MGQSKCLSSNQTNNQNVHNELIDAYKQKRKKELKRTEHNKNKEKKNVKTCIYRLHSLQNTIAEPAASFSFLLQQY